MDLIYIVFFFFSCDDLCDLDNTQDLTKGNQIEYNWYVHISYTSTSKLDGS